MDDIKLFRGADFKVNENITINHLKVGEIIDFSTENGEQQYFDIVNLFLIRPYDIMDKLDDIGVDYEEIREYELFIKLYRSGSYQEAFAKLLNGSNYEASMDTQTQSVVLYDHESNGVIDEEAYTALKDAICKIHYIKQKPVPKAGNETLKKFRIKQKRKQREKENASYESQLLNLTSSLIIGSDGSVTFENVWDLPIYTAYTLFAKMLKLQDYTNTMLGVYTGNISLKDVGKDALQWTSQ